MMKLIFFLLFLIPLYSLDYFFIQYMMFIISFVFLMSLNNFSLQMNISYVYSFDVYSYFFIMLSFWICTLMILASVKIYNKNNYYEIFIFLVIFLLMMLVLVFSSMNMFLFYMFFEVSLLPLMFIIIGWGYQPERLMAGFYMFFYTIFFSLPMMVGLFILYKSLYSFMFFELLNCDNLILYLLINMVFFVKIPLFMIHLWLPKAHVEAPVSGSMILAGVMLKLGGYGLIRFMKLFCFYFYLNMFFIIISLIGSLIICFICLAQTDMKMLIAYSSVSHMGIVLCSILILGSMSFKGAFIMMLGHGLCASGLFCLVNIYYERFNSRSLYLIKGLINIIPNIMFFMFIFSINNMSAPPSLNLLGEIFMFTGLVNFSYLMIFYLSLFSFLGAVYSIYLYSYSSHGSLSSSLYNFYMGLNREYLLMFLHVVPLNFMILMSDFFMF